MLQFLLDQSFSFLPATSVEIAVLHMFLRMGCLKISLLDFTYQRSLRGEGSFALMSLMTDEFQLISINIQWSGCYSTLLTVNIELNSSGWGLRVYETELDSFKLIFSWTSKAIYSGTTGSHLQKALREASITFLGKPDYTMFYGSAFLFPHCNVHEKSFHHNEIALGRFGGALNVSRALHF